MKTATFTPHARKALALAGGMAQRMGHDHVGSEHLLLGLLLQPQCGAARLLREAGVEREWVQIGRAHV